MTKKGSHNLPAFNNSLLPQAYPIPAQTTLFITLEQTKTMKFFSSLIVALLAGNAAGFSAVAPKPSTPAASDAAPSLEPIDKSMTGIDAPGSFDPTEGDSPALKRNNNDGVWVEQVSRSLEKKYIYCSFCS